MRCKLIHIVILFPLFYLCQSTYAQKNTALSLKVEDYCVDSIMDYVIFYAPYYEKMVSEYNATQYIKADLNIMRKNFFFRYLPSLFRPKKGVREYVIESASETHFTAPNIYDQRVIAITGTTPRLKGASAEALKYFNINVYSQSLLANKLLSPFSKKAKKYYKYNLERVDRGVGGYTEFTISYRPKKKSIQTLEGYFVVSSDVWSIRSFKFKGSSEYFDFTNYVKLGEVGQKEEFLHTECQSKTTFRFVGNKIRSNFKVIINYDQIKADPLSKRIKKKTKYDLTESFSLQTNDTIQKIRKDFQPYRKIPLTTKEENLYRDFEKAQKTDSISLISKEEKKSKTSVFWGSIGDALISNSRINLYDVGSVKFSPLINPFLLSYSGRDGWSYKYKIKYNQLFSKGKMLSITPTLGYRFNKKEFYWNGKVNFDYYPQRRARINLDFGNGNRIYSSEFLDDLKGKADSIDFDKLHLTYFKSLHMDLMNTVEIANGLELGVGITASRRKAVRNSYIDSISEQVGITDKYITVAPRVSLSWTPGMYSYMDGKRKKYVYSKYPTFTIDWERGIKGLFSSTGSHERIELDIQHKISLGLMRNFYYRIGGGLFTNQEQMYFVDFIYFAKRNLPVGWNDDIGGTFQLLDERWYNASQYYGRANIVYETPFLLLPHFRGLTKWVLKERIYVNAVMMNQLRPYVEVGYGIGTHIFDLGLFLGTMNGKAPKFGFKVTFELFNR